MPINYILDAVHNLTAAISILQRDPDASQSHVYAARLLLERGNNSDPSTADAPYGVIEQVADELHLLADKYHDNMWLSVELRALAYRLFPQRLSVTRENLDEWLAEETTHSSS